MYIIIVYDIAHPKRGIKLLNFLRTRLTWIQNSVFEGELTESGLEIVKKEIRKIIKPAEDSVIYYTFDSRNYTTRKVIGLEKNQTDPFL